MNNNNIIKGPKPTVSIKEITFFGEHLFKIFQKHENKIAMVDHSTGIEISYASLLKISNQVAKFLTGTSSIAVVSPNTLNFFVPVLGALFSGAVCATVNYNYNPSEFDHAFKICKPQVIFVASCAIQNILEIVELNPCIQKIVILENAKSNTFRSTIPIITLDDIYNSIPLSLNQHCNRKRDNQVIMILFSSGTTGLSKGVELTDTNLLTLIYNMLDPQCNPITSSYVTIGILPFFHGFGFGISLSIFTAGAKIIVMEKFNTINVLESIPKFKVTNLYLVPAMLLQMAKYSNLEKYNFSSVKGIVCGAAPVGLDVMELFKRRTGLDCFFQGFGCTEATMATHLESPKFRKHGSCGKLLPGLESKIIDLNNGASLGPNKKGELCIRGPVVMKGYLGNDFATKECLDPDGFLHTGDVCYYDEEEFFFVVDRIKELIKYKGYQVPPAELENLLLTHPAIKDCAVIGIKDKEAGEVPKAFIVLRQEYVNKIWPKEFVNFVQERVINYKRLRGGVQIVDSIPKNASGKILRRVLRLSSNNSNL